MQFRHMSHGNSNFSDWLEKRNREASGEPAEDEESFFPQWSTFQDSFSSQLQILSGNLPSSGPLSAAFRARLKNAIYLILLSILFFVLAIFIGIPTIVLRPAKFVMCMCLGTICAAAAIIQLQSPPDFLANAYQSGIQSLFPSIALVSCLLFTIYTTVVMHSYILTIFCGVLQLLCIAYFLASYIPGGQTGVYVLMKGSYAMMCTLLSPMIYFVRSVFRSVVSSIFS